MESNHRDLVVTQAPSPLDHGTGLKWTYWDSHPDFRPAMPASSFWTISPIFVIGVAGAGIEPADPWFKAADFYQQKLPRNHRVTVIEGRAGLEPARWCLTGTRSAAELPTQNQF